MSLVDLVSMGSILSVTEPQMWAAVSPSPGRQCENRPFQECRREEVPTTIPPSSSRPGEGEKSQVAQRPYL